MKVITLTRVLIDNRSFKYTKVHILNPASMISINEQEIFGKEYEDGLLVTKISFKGGYEIYVTEYLEYVKDRWEDSINA